MYTHEDIIMPTIMSCGVSTPEATEFKSKIGFKQHDITLTKEQSVTSKMIRLFAKGKILLLQCFGYRTDLYFLKLKLAAEIYEKGHTDRDEEKKKKEEK